MKKTFMAIVLANTICLGLFAQEKNGKSITPPENVKAAFEKAFPGTSKVKWEKEGNGYEVNFVQQNKEMSAVFDSKGGWKETEEEIPVTSLPAAVASYVKNHYKGAKIKEAAKITSPGGVVTYEAEVNGVDLIFDAQGNFIKEQKG